MSRLINTTKRRGPSVLFKTSPDTIKSKVYTIVYSERGQTKSATFKGDGYRERAAAKIREIQSLGCHIISASSTCN